MAGREHNKAMRNWVKHTEKRRKNALKRKKWNSAITPRRSRFEERFLEMLPEPVKAPQTQAEEVEYEEVLDFNTVRKVPKAVEVEAEEISEFNRDWEKGLELLKKSKGR